MNVTPMALPDVLLVTPKLHGDARGLFLEAWNASAYEMIGITSAWVQDNMSVSPRGVLRGMHCQVKQVQGKLVRCAQGSVFDVAVDLRASSPTFGQWCGSVLDDQRHASMWIPAGFAHGYLVLSGQATLHYKVTDYYAPQYERCLRWDDPGVRIDWPIPSGARPQLSERDAIGASLDATREWFG